MPSWVFPETSPLLFTAAALATGILLHLLILAGLRHYLNRSPWLIWCILWLTITATIANRFEVTLPLANFIVDVLLLPLVCALLAWVIAQIGLKIANRGLHSYFTDLECAYQARPPGNPRWRQRLQMKRQVAAVMLGPLCGIGAVVLWGRLLNLNLGAVLAGAGFFTLGLSLAAKDLLADWFAGINIVLEDQFGVGDLITVNGQFGQYDGRVECFTLRVTQLRGPEGNLITIPNSALRAVSNLAVPEVVATLNVTLPADLPMQEALELVTKACQDTPHELECPGDFTPACGVQLRLQLKVPPEARQSALLQVATRIDFALRQRPKRPPEPAAESTPT